MKSGRHFTKISAHIGGATHSGTPGSHVNKKSNKRIANKAIRRMQGSEEHQFELSLPAARRLIHLKIEDIP